MIHLKQLTLQRGTKVLLDNANLTIQAKQKIGVVGANGAGKTSLFMLLQNDIREEFGEVLIASDLRIAHIKQEMPEGEQSALDYTLEGDAEYAKLQAQLAIAEAEDDGMTISAIHTRLGEIDGYALPSKAAKVLLGLGFTQAQLYSPLGSLSGGWRMRLNLAQVLMSRADFLLLDEPTNHLDMEAIIWLEDWLKQLTETALIISHDREFLDKVTTHTVHFHAQQLTMYTGNYSAFEKLRNEQLAVQQATYQKQQQAKQHLQSFVDRFRAKASKAKQAQSRLKMLERMDWVEKVETSSPFRFKFKPTAKAGNPMLSIHQANVGYDDLTVLHKINASISDGDRIGLIGPNGAGKSTFVKLLAQELAEQSGEITASNKIKVGYFAQHQLEQLDGEEGALKHLQQLDSKITEREGRQYLGGFNFQGDTVFQPVASFSGGEKARLVLALLIWQAPNLLLLDEPTNHLDLDMREALTLALQQYEGAVVVVSHDRFLLKNVIDELWLVAEGKVRPFDGDVEDYRIWFKEYFKAQQANEAPKTIKPKRQSATTQKNIEKLEKKLEKLQTKLAEIDERLTDNALYTSDNKDELDTLTSQRAQVAQDIDSIEEKILGML